jgi:hypothetical protein
MKMKKIICICICIFLTSGCGKLANHGSPVNVVVENKGSEGVSPHSLTSNTPAPTPEPSKSVQPLSAPSDTGSSVRKYAVNISLFAAALVVIACAAVYRCVSPEIFEDVYIVPEIKKILYVDKLTSEQATAEGYRKCRYHSVVAGTSYIWRFFIRKVKKTIRHWSYFDSETGEMIEGVPPSLALVFDNGFIYLFYKPNS